MSPFVLPVIFIAIVYFAILFFNERYNLLSCDRFSSPAMKVLAYLWLGLFLAFLTVLIVGSALTPATKIDLARVPFYSLFTLHAILVIFLLGWWLLTGRPHLADFFNLRSTTGTTIMTGLAVGVGGWIVTIIMALMIALILQATGLLPKAPQPPAMIAWLSALPVWKKCLIVLSAMTIEEAFFRGWLQKRVGLIASTVLFALAHSGLGQPFLLIGVALISLVIGFTFYRTKNLVPGIIAHGVFDAVQLFVIIPIAFKAAGLG
jgi:membrane protease YdiL (CAAX protease family)